MDREGLRSLFDLTGRVAIVTGGTRGIGRAVAEGLVAAGAKVVVVSRKADACAETQAALEAMGGEALGVPAHLGELEACQTVVDATVDRFGAVDILVNNAANALTEPVGEFTPGGYEKSLAVNLRGPVFLTQAARPHLAASQHSSVVNVISVGAFMYSPGTALYAMGKSALFSFTRDAAAAFAHEGIRVNALAPGSVDTYMLNKMTEDVIDRLRTANLQQRIAAPDEMVGPVLFLASDASSYVTGQVLVADGGLVAY